MPGIDLESRIVNLSTLLVEQKLMMASAESCTGGLLAKIATDLAGSSNWFSRAIVSYSNASKQDLLNVSALTLEKYGAVSEQTVTEMVEGLFLFDEVGIGTAISGIAGPTGGSKDKPVGTVWISWKLGKNPVLKKRFLFNGDRAQIRVQAALEAVNGLIFCIENSQS